MSRFTARQSFAHWSLKNQQHLGPEAEAEEADSKGGEVPHFMFLFPEPEGKEGRQHLEAEGELDHPPAPNRTGRRTSTAMDIRLFHLQSPLDSIASEVQLSGLQDHLILRQDPRVRLKISRRTGL